VCRYLQPFQTNYCTQNTSNVDQNTGEKVGKYLYSENWQRQKTNQNLQKPIKEIMSSMVRYSDVTATGLTAIVGVTATHNEVPFAASRLKDKIDTISEIVTSLVKKANDSDTPVEKSLWHGVSIQHSEMAILEGKFNNRIDVMKRELKNDIVEHLESQKIGSNNSFAQLF
jgi:hypothetical protein